MASGIGSIVRNATLLYILVSLIVAWIEGTLATRATLFKISIAVVLGFAIFAISSRGNKD